jgi:RNA polymerase sigma-70 factor (ECF subfamily)
MCRLNTAYPPAANSLCERFLAGVKLPCIAGCCGLAADEALAEDLLSEVFLAVWQQVASFDGRSSASTWLLSMARHKAVSARQCAVDVKLNEDAVAKLPDTEDDSWHVLDRAEALRHTLPRLSPQHSEVIDLVYYHGKSVKEIAEIVGADEATVKTRMFNARRELAELAELRTYALALKSRLAPTAYNGNHRTSPGVRGSGLTNRWTFGRPSTRRWRAGFFSRS